MTPFTISASENLRLLDPARRECYFEDEKELDFYTTYSLANCASECKLKATYEKFGCLPWYLPSIYQRYVKKSNEMLFSTCFWFSASVHLNSWHTLKQI